MVVYASRGNEKFKIRLTPSEVLKYDNGAMVSCGIMAPDCIDEWVKTGKAIVISYDEWNHSGCQSRCIKRGDNLCQW